MKGIARFEARLEAIEVGKRPALEPELRAFLASLGAGQIIALSTIALSGKVPDLAALDSLAAMPGSAQDHTEHGPQCRVCGKPGIERRETLPMCDDCYRYMAGPEQ